MFIREPVFTGAVDERRIELVSYTKKTLGVFIWPHRERNYDSEQKMMRELLKGVIGEKSDRETPDARKREPNPCS